MKGIVPKQKSVDLWYLYLIHAISVIYRIIFHSIDHFYTLPKFFLLMKRTKHFTGLSFYLSLIVGLLAVTGCQQEDLYLAQQDSQAMGESHNYPELEKLVLDRYFHVSTNGLTDKEVTAKYDEMVSRLPEEAQINLTQSINKMGARHEAALSTPAPSTYRFSPPRPERQFAIEAPVPARRFSQSVALAPLRVYAGSEEVQKVYEYTNPPSGLVTPTLISTITPSVPAEAFGGSIAVSGNWMAVGAPGVFGDPGQVFLFKHIGGNWVEQAILSAPGGNVSFGLSLSLKGNTLAVVSIDLTTLEGTISVFKYAGNQWQLQNELERPGNFWLNVDLDVTGNRLVAASLVNFNFTTLTASVFSRTGSNWAFEQELVVADTAAAAIAGAVINLGRVVITAFEPGDRQYLFTHNGNNWSFAQDLVHPGSIDNNRSADIQGNKIVIGAAAGNADNLPESVYVFEKQGATFNLTQTLTPNDGGVDVTLSSIDILGNNVAFGCFGEDPSNSGRFYVIKL